MNEKCEIRHWKGYIGHREGEPIGGGRMLSKKLLENLNWTPWENIYVNKSLDSYFISKIKTLEIKQKVLDCSEKNGFIFTIRTKTNITNMRNIGELTNSILIERKIAQINKLKDIQKTEI